MALQSVLGTTGDDTLTTNLTTNYVVDALDGDDTITIEETANNVEIQAGKGEDLVVTAGDISDSDKIKGGGGSDTFDFQGHISNSSIYGGKAGDSIVVTRAVSSSQISGDTGKDTITLNGKINSSSIIDGGADDDLITLNERITSSTILGGAARDTIDINDNSDNAVIKSGTDNDSITIQGKHGSLTAKTNTGDDTITIESGFTGSGNEFYAGQGEDVVSLESVEKVSIYGDKDDDSLTVAADVDSNGASLFGGHGNDTIDASASDAAETPKFFFNGNSGDDSLTGSDGIDTIRGGKGDDTIGAADGGAKTFYGDNGDDKITLSSATPSQVFGGDDDDTITSSVITDAAGVSNTKGHSITGGKGIDSITVTGVQLNTLANGYATQNFTTTLKYSSLAEFITSNEVVDSIDIADQTAVIAEIAGKLSITTSDDFSRVTTAGGKRALGDREGLILATASTVKTGSNIRIDSAADDYIAGFDLSAGTTGNSTINASAANTRAMALIGGSGRDTILGGKKDDAIIGNAGADSLEGGEGVDHLDGGAGIDTIKGGDGADTIDVSGNGEQTADDVIDGGADSNGFNIDTTAGAVTAEFDFDNITSVDAFGTTSTNSANITFSAISETTSQTVTYVGGAGALTIDNNSASSNTKFDITGGAAVDNFEGSDGNDTLKGLGAADVLSGGGGNDMFVYDTDDNLVTGNAFIDQISGGTGTDSIVIDPEAGDAAFVIAATDSFARVTGVTTIAAKTLCDEDITISLIDDSGINTIDLSADTDTTGTNTVDVSAEDTAGFTIIGAANATADVITDSAVDDTIIGLAGADDISIATGGDDIIKFNAIGDVGDVIDGFEMGANKDALDLSAIAVGTGYSEQTAASAVDTGTVGILVLDATTANSANNISAANLYSAAISADTNTAAGESLFIAHTTHKTNAANVFIHKATINANNDGFDALTLVATLEGLTTTASFDTTNFTLS